MEEILASIRRIIEDSDSGRKLVEEDVDGGSQAETAESHEPEPEVDAFRAELRAAPDVEDKPAYTKPTTLADVQAQLSAVAEEPAKAEPTVRPALSLAEVGAQLAAGQAMPPREAASADTITADWRRDIAAAGRQAADVVPPTTKPTEAAVAVQAEDPEIQAEISSDELAAALEEPQPGGEAQLRPALVSEQTSRQVAASFGELSEAFASRGRKSFDEMAEEMLRPMLQDWLDNNLPTLVERLVREEIERVARGG